MSTPARKILIAMDGSKNADYAFDWYIKYFYKEKDDVLLVVVDEHGIPAPASVFQPLAPPQTTSENGKNSTIPTAAPSFNEGDEGPCNLVVQLQKKLQAAGVLFLLQYLSIRPDTSSREVKLKGNVLRLAGVKAGEGIVTASEENKSDLIISGTRGTGGNKRILMGSVILYVVHNAHIPVLIVRQQ